MYIEKCNQLGLRTLQARENLPIRDNSSIEILACMGAVLSTMPKKVKHVVGPSTFSALIGAPIAW